MAWGLVQHKVVSLASGTSGSGVFNTSPTAGNLLLALIAVNTTGSTIGTPTETNSTYSPMNASQSSATTGQTCRHFAAVAGSSTSATVNVGWTGTATGTLLIAEFSGISGGLSQDGSTAYADGVDGAANLTYTPGTTGDLLIYYIGTSGSVGALSGGGWTPGDVGMTGTGNAWGYQSGTLSAVIGTSNEGASENGFIFGIKAAGTGGGSVNQSASETVAVTDTAVASVAGGSIDVSDLEYHGSGASNLGGAIAGVITGGETNNVWDDVTSGESASGDVEYRCIYIKNAHPTTTWIAPKVWIDTQATPDTAAIALDSAAVGSTAASTSANETTAPTGGGAPYTFTSPTTKATGLQIADIPPLQYKAIWLRRTVPSSAAANPADAMSVRCEGSTP